MNNLRTHGALVLRCLLRALGSGRAVRYVQPPRAVCIVQVAKLGDMVCTTPMFRAVKAAYPDTKVFVVGNALNRELLEGNKDVDGYVVWEGGWRAMQKKIAALGCDFGCTTSPNVEGLGALYLAGVPGIAVPKVVGGSTILETHAYRLLRLLVGTVPHTLHNYAPREYVRLLEPIGVVSDDTTKHLVVSPAAQRNIAALTDSAGLGSRFAIVAPGSGHPLKRWPPERFAAVAEYIAEHYMPVAVLGSPADAHEVAAMMAHVSHSHVVNLSGRFSVEELKAFIGRAALFVSGDTGPLYIAEALEVPTIDIVGPASDTSQPPHGPRHLVIAPPRTMPAMTVFITQQVDQEETRRQAEATQIPEVLNAIDALLART